nr:hypothetical protein [Tanacetum cinerariifolium]
MRIIVCSHQCSEEVHWRRNYPVYLAELMKKKMQVGFASNSGAWNSLPTHSSIYTMMTYLSLLFKGLPFEARIGSSPDYNQQPLNSFEWRKTIFGMVTNMGICQAKPYTLRGGPSTKLEKRLFKAWQLDNHSKNSLISSKPDRAYICTISGVIRGTVTISLVQTKSSNCQIIHLLLRQDKRGRNHTTTGLAFVEANYEALGSLLSEDSDKEREVEPSPEPTRAATSPLRSKEESRVKRNTEGRRPLEEAPRGNKGQSMILPLLLAAHLGKGENGQPLQSSLTSAYEGEGLPNNIGGNLPSNAYVCIPKRVCVYHTKLDMCCLEPYGFSNTFCALDGGLSSLIWTKNAFGSYDRKGGPYNFLHLFEGTIRMQKQLMPVACHMFTYTLKDFARIWWNSQKACSILDYKDLKAKFRSHFSQQKKFTNSYLAVHNIKKSFSHGLRTKSLVEHLSTDLPSTHKGLIKKTYTWVEAREVATNGGLSDRRDSFERSKRSSWENNKGLKNKDRFSPYRGPNHGLLSSLSKSPNEILATEKAARSFEPPPNMFGSKPSRDMS